MALAMYKIQRVDSAVAERLEPLGTKRKFWFTNEQNQRVLFKAEARGTGEDWAEKVACELSTLLGLPHVHYELASDSANIPGVICVTCAPPPSALILGNQLMFERDRNYPASVRKVQRLSTHNRNGFEHRQKFACTAFTVGRYPARWNCHFRRGVSGLRHAGCLDRQSRSPSRKLGCASS